MRILIVLMLLFAGLCHAEPDALNDALRAQEAGDDVKAANLLLPLAKKGDPIAQFNLGVLYSQSQVILKDYRIAMQWYLAAAQQGNAQAQDNAGELYAAGKGVTQDYRKAMTWFALSAKQGNSSAQLHIGEMYAAGQGVPQDDSIAIKWLHLAADQGNAVAQFKLAEAYEKGQGLPQDSALASKLMSTAADNARDEATKSAYMARRDTIEKEIASQKLAKEQQLAREEAERVRAAEAIRAEAARIKAAQAAQILAAEQAKQQAAAAAALKAAIQARKLAAIEAKAKILQAQQQTKDERKLAAEKRKSKLDIQMARRRAEINAEARRREREISASSAKQHVKAMPKNDMNEKASRPEKNPPPLPAHRLTAKVHPADEQPAADNNKTAKKATGKTVKDTGEKYPARVELTDEELKHPLIHFPKLPPRGETGVQSPTKQIEWSKKPAAPE